MNDISTNAGILRHGLNYLWPSEIANQWYCEYKVHLQRLHPEVRIELPPLEMGEEGHLALASQAEPITADEIERSIRTGQKLAICEWVMEGCFQGVRIRGRPDFFAFEGKQAHLILDFKFSRKPKPKPFPDHEVQAEIYALLAESMDFSTEQLCFGIVMFPTSGFEGGLRDAALAKAVMLQFLNEEGTLQNINDLCEKTRKALVSGKAKAKTIGAEAWKAFLYRYDRKKAEKDLTWALEYWLSEREPKPTRRPPKCFSCPLNAAGLCDHALQHPDPNFKVQRRPGEVFVYR